MGQPDNYYDIVCRGRFDTHDKKLDELDQKVDKLNQTVNNGLLSRVKNVYRVLWLLVGSIVLEGIASRFIDLL